MEDQDQDQVSPTPASASLTLTSEVATEAREAALETQNASSIGSENDSDSSTSESDDDGSSPEHAKEDLAIKNFLNHHSFEQPNTEDERKIVLAKIRKSSAQIDGWADVQELEMTEKTLTALIIQDGALVLPRQPAAENAGSEVVSGGNAVPADAKEVVTTMPATSEKSDFDEENVKSILGAHTARLFRIGKTSGLSGYEKIADSDGKNEKRVFLEAELERYKGQAKTSFFTATKTAYDDKAKNLERVLQTKK